VRRGIPPVGDTASGKYQEKFPFYSAKIRKKKKGRRGREKRKRRSPVQTSVWRYILVLIV
jgi:hypothetical protein